MLDKITALLNEKPSIKLVIAGHTDSTGPDDFNMGLSKRRAKSVQQYFVKSGLAKSKFKIEGYGFHKPIATNDTREGRSKNRRVSRRETYL